MAAALKTKPATALTAITSFTYGPELRAIMAGETLPADDDACRRFPAWFADPRDENPTTEDQLIAAQVAGHVWQPPPESQAKERPPLKRAPLSGTVRARCAIDGILPPTEDCDRSRPVHIEAGEVLDAQHVLVQLGPENFEEVK